MRSTLFKGGIELRQLFDIIYFNNRVLDYLLFLISLIACFVAIKVLGYFIVKAIKRKKEKTDSSLNDLLLRGLRQYVYPILYLAAAALCIRLLHWNPTLERILDAGILAVIALYGALITSMFAVFLFQKYWEGKARLGEIEGDVADTSNAPAIKWMSVIIKAVIWGIALILFLDNIGVKINSLLAGLGIGGLAIAFAAQTILADIFCFFTILFDRPFEVGDFITVGEQMGTVEHIGVKTTRLRALSGEQLIFSNGDLTGSRIQNYKTMEQRRVLFSLGVTYSTRADKLKEIPGMIQEIVEQVADTKFGRAHFSSYGDFSLNFEIVYFVLSNDYDRYMDIHQEVNLRIKEEFDRRGIDFAFPTVTVDRTKLVI